MQVMKLIMQSSPILYASKMNVRSMENLHNHVCHKLITD